MSTGSADIEPMTHTLAESTELQAQYRTSSNLDARITLHARFSTARQSLQAWEFDCFSFPADARILDVGCGTGLLWQVNRKRLVSTWQLVLSDLSSGMLETARQAQLPARFLQCDAQALPFPGNYFDVVIANHMLYHVPVLSLALTEIRRVLKPDGKLYATTNGQAHLRELDELAGEIPAYLQQATARFTLENGAPQLAEHFREVRRMDFEDGLRVTEVEPLIAYIKSMRVAKSLTPEFERQVRELIAARIAQEGAFRITKSPGLFEATK